MDRSLLKFPKVLILILLVSIANFLGILITPALPAIGDDYGISDQLAAWLMSAYMIGYAVGQLPFGPLANRYGRKGAITVSMATAFLGTAIAFFAHEFWVLCMGRIIQALGAAGGLKIGFTIIGDLYGKRVPVKTMATLSAAFGFMPGVARAVGGTITQYFGWQACFFFLMIYVLIVWLLTRMIEETKPERDGNALHIDQIVKNYARYFTDPFLTSHAFLMGLATLVIYIFATFGPFIGIDTMGLNPKTFGFWAIIPSFGIVAGALISRIVLSSENVRINILLGILILLISNVIVAACFAAGKVSIACFFVPTFFIYLGSNIAWSNALAKGTSEADDKSNASAVLQFINLSIATIGIFICQVVPLTPTALYPTSIGILSIGMLAIWIRLKAHHQKTG